MDLTGKTILITRDAKQAEHFARLIEKHKGIPIIFPTIELTSPPNWEICDNAIKNIENYDGLIFTCANSVKFFMERYLKLGIAPALLKNKLTFTAGYKTKKEVESHGLNSIAIPETTTHYEGNLLEKIDELKNKHFLYPKGNLTSNYITTYFKYTNSKIDEIIVYHAKQPNQKDINQIRDLLIQKRIDVTTFTSPSTFNNFVILFSTSEIEKIFDNTKIAALDRITAKRVREAGFKVDIQPERATIEALLQEIIFYYQPNYKHISQHAKNSTLF